MINFLKKFTIFSLFLANFLALALIFVPIIYEEDIKAMIDKTASQTLKARLFYDDIYFNLFSDFPNITLSMTGFGMVGKGDFKNDTLVYVKEFEIVPNIWSVIAEDQIQVKGILADGLALNIKVLKDGQANYDIVRPSEPDTTTSDSSSLKINLEYWNITNSSIKYGDETMQFFMTMYDINHDGSGEFVGDIFDFTGKLTAEKFNVDFEGINYMNEKRLDVEARLAMDIDKFKFTFKENYAKLNDFAFSFDGFFQMFDDRYEMDVNFGAENTAFKTLLSLVPNEFSADMEGLETEGELEFNGFVKGIYNDTQMPAFQVKLKTEDASVKYPDLPMAVQNIFVDLLIDNPDGNLENTVTDIRNFSLNLGNNPVKGQFRVKGLTNYAMNGNVNAKVNLDELTQVFPIDSLTVKGVYELHLKLNGIYSESQETIPKIDAEMTLKEGFIKSDAYPIPVEKITVLSSVQNTSGKLADTQIDLSKLALEADGQPFEINGYFHNLDDINYQINVNGTIDLEKVTKAFPLEGMDIKGMMKANIKTGGTQSAALAQEFDKLPTSGKISLQNFIFTGDDVPHPVKIDDALLTFTPAKLLLEKYKGFLGKSDVSLSGEINNYLAFALEDSAVLQGKLNLASQNFDVNEWMLEDSTEVPETDTTSLTVVEIPKNVNFSFQSDLKKISYDNLNLENAKGLILVKEGTVKLDDFSFGTLGGEFAMNGTYDPRNLDNPKFDFGFKIQHLDFKKSAKTFNTIQNFAPVAEKIEGTFSTNLNLKGSLGMDMMPLPESLTGGGIFQILNADLQDIEILKKIGEMTKLPDLNHYKLKDLDLNIAFENGRLLVDTVDVKLGDYQAKVQGSAGYDKTTDFDINLDIPKNKSLQKLSSELDKLTDGSQSENETVQVDLKIVGTFDSPKIKVSGSDTKDQIKEDAKNKLRKEGEKAKDSALNLAKDILTDTTGTAKEKVNEAVDKLKDKFKIGKKKE